MSGIPTRAELPRPELPTCPLHGEQPIEFLGEVTTTLTCGARSSDGTTWDAHVDQMRLEFERRRR